MKFHILTLFPEMILGGLHLSILGKAAENNIISIDAVDIREYSREKHRKVDDYPYGGGAGMLMQAQPVYDAHRVVTGGRPVRTIYVTPQGEPFTQMKAEELAGEEELVLLCGHYEGIDERVLEEIVTDYISIGDYVLTGGELPAMVMVDAISRLIPGVLGNDISSEEESFHNDLLEYPHYSRPECWHGKRVPEVLLSGNHRKVAAWRLEQSLRRTEERRPDLYARYQAKEALVRQLSREKRNHIHMMESLSRGYAEILYVSQAVYIKSLKSEKDIKKREQSENIEVLLYDRRNKICMVSARDIVSGEDLAHFLPESTEYIISSQTLEEQKRYQRYLTCSIMLYTQKVSLPLKYKKIRLLSPADLSLLECFGAEFSCGIHWEKQSNVHGESAGNYIWDRMEKGALYGIFVEGKLAGVAGIHKGGSMGLLYVDTLYRRQGIAMSLTAYVVNRILEKGWTPYGYVPAENPAAEKLLERLGFYTASKKVEIYIKSI